MSTAQAIVPKPKIWLDIGCGTNKQKGWVGMDVRAVDGVDVVHDLEEFPWPLETGSVAIIQASHILEHVLPRKQIPLWDEMWRVLEPDGELRITVPHGQSYGYLQDPTHCAPYVEATFEYYSPFCPLYDIYQPKPWRIILRESQQICNILCVMRTLTEEQGEEIWLKHRRQFWPHKYHDNGNQS